MRKFARNYLLLQIPMQVSDIGTDYSETLREAKVSELILVVLHVVG